MTVLALRFLSRGDSSPWLPSSTLTVWQHPRRHAPAIAMHIIRYVPRTNEPLGMQIFLYIRYYIYFQGQRGSGVIRRVPAFGKKRKNDESQILSSVGRLLRGTRYGSFFFFPSAPAELEPRVRWKQRHITEGQSDQNPNLLSPYFLHITGTGICFLVCERARVLPSSSRSPCFGGREP